MNYIVKTTELALIRGLPVLIIPKLKKSRLLGRCEKLVKLIDQELVSMPRLTMAECETVKDTITEFAKRTGWEGKERHVATYISFLMALIDDSEFSCTASYKKYAELLGDIFDYFDRHAKQKHICFVAGDIAEKKWREIIT